MNETTSDARASADDRWLRRALEPGPDAVARVIATARAGEDRDGARRHPRWGWAAAAAAVAVAVAVSIALLLAPAVPPPAAEGAAARIRISNENGPIVVTSTAGHRWIQLRNPGGEP